MTTMAPMQVTLNKGALRVRLDERVRSPAQVDDVLRRFGERIEDEGWSVTIDGNVLHATKHDGVFNGSLSPMGRLTRGETVVWQEDGDLRLDFRPDWPAALVDTVLAVAILRWLIAPWRNEYVLEVGLLTLLGWIAMAAQMPLIRRRFQLLLSRAAWIEGADWDRARRWASVRRAVWPYVRWATLGLGSAWWIDKHLRDEWWAGTVEYKGHWVMQALYVVTIAAVGLIVMLDINAHIRKGDRQ